MTTPRDNELANALFGSQEAPAQTMMGAIKEAALGLFPGLKGAIPEAKEQLTYLGNLGRSEVANALFGQGAFVLYSHEPQHDHGKDAHEQAQDSQTMQQDSPSQHLERGGRSM